jgi:hypothetical protein
MRTPALLLSVLGFVSPLLAATRIWDGGDPLAASWTDPDNWDANTAPLAHDDLVFPPGLAAPDLACTNDFPAGTVFKSLLFQGTGYTVDGNALRVSGWIDQPLADGFPGTTSINVPVVAGDDNLSVGNQGNLTQLVFGSTFDLAGLSTIRINANGGVIRFNGGLIDSAGTGNLLKFGSATTVLGAGATANSHASTTVYQGRWIVNGIHQVPVGVLEGATAGGTGTIDDLGLSGTLAPGDSTASNTRATLTVSGDLGFGATGRLQVELSNPPAASDRVRATGTVFIGTGAMLDVVLPDPLHLKTGDVFRVIDKTSAGPLGGVNFANAPDGGTLAVGRVTFGVTYSGGTGNDLELTVQSIAPGPINREWDGGGNNDLWSNPENWVGDDVPDAGDVLLFRPGADRLFPINDLREDLFFRSIFVTSGTYAFTGNRVLLDGLEVNVSDADLVFALPMRFAGSPNTVKTVSYDGDKAFHWTSHVNKDGAPLFLEIRNFGQGPAGLRMAATLELSGAQVRLTNFSPLPVDWRPTFAACQELIFTGGFVTVPDVPGETNAGIWNVGHVPDAPDESWPATVTIANGLKIQPGAVRMGDGVLRAAPAASVQQSLGQLRVVGDAVIESPAGATMDVLCDSLVAEPGSSLACGVPVRTFATAFPLEIASGATCELSSFSKEFTPTTATLDGGGRLICGAMSNISSLAVRGGSTLEWKGADAGSAALDLTLGKGLPDPSPGHLAGSGTCRDVTVAIAASEISPGAAPGGYGTLTLRRLDFDIGGSLRFDIGGTLPGVNHDRVEVLQAANYADLTSVWIDLAPAYAPPAGTASVLVAHDVFAAINANSNMPFEGIIAGQRFTVALSLGDGNDLALVKQAVPAPLTGPAAGLAAGWLQITNLPTGAATYHLPARGMAGLAYVLESSGDLLNWTVAGQYLLEAGGPPQVDFTATAPVILPSQPRRFFRLRPL